MARQQEGVPISSSSQAERPRRASLPPEERTGPQQRNTEEENSLQGMPRSAVRYRPVGKLYVIPLSDGSEMHVTERELDDLPADYQYAAQLITLPQKVATPRQRRQPHPKRPTPSDGTVYQMPSARTAARDTEEYPRQSRHRSLGLHWLIWVGCALLLMLVGWIVLSAVGTWWQTKLDDWHYGRPRIYQIDANVGHGTPQHPDSHFIAVNLNRHIIIIEIPGNDPSRACSYIGPVLIGPGEDLTPVTLSFEDVNNDGRPDLAIHVKESQFIFLNQSDGTFKPAPNQ